MKLEAKSLVKAKTLLIQHPSPANLHSTRLALHVDDYTSSCDVFLASGSYIYKLQIPMEKALSLSPAKGKESLLIPQETQILHSSILNRCPHLSEIQSIVLSEIDCTGYSVVGSVDAYGHLIVSKLDTSGTGADMFTYSVLPHDSGVGEGSWVGLCFSSHQWSMAAIARSFGKRIDVYDRDAHVRTLHTLWYPSSLSFLESLNHGTQNSILAVTEGCQLTIWDLRVKENGGCINRICGSVGDILYAIASSSSGYIAVGGADRSITVYDPRRWAAVSRWINCSKYEITGLAFSSINASNIYVQGIDNEVFCGQWKERNKVFSFKGDSNWLGFSKCSNRDVVAGWCDSGSVFVADVGSASHVNDFS